MYSLIIHMHDNIMGEVISVFLTNTHCSMGFARSKIQSIPGKCHPYAFSDLHPLYTLGTNSLILCVCGGGGGGGGWWLYTDVMVRLKTNILHKLNSPPPIF